MRICSIDWVYIYTYIYTHTYLSKFSECDSYEHPWLVLLFPTHQSGVVRIFILIRPSPSLAPHATPPPPLYATDLLPVSLQSCPLYPTDLCPVSSQWCPLYPTDLLPVSPQSCPLHLTDSASESSEFLQSPPTDSAPDSLESLQSSPIPDRFSPRVPGVPPVVVYTKQIR